MTDKKYDLENRLVSFASEMIFYVKDLPPDMLVIIIVINKLDLLEAQL